MTTLEGKKKNQHYIWQHYLKSWASDHEQVFCLRSNYVFTTATRNIGSQNSFYKQIKLTHEELLFIEMFITSRADKHLQELHRKFLQLISLPFVIATSLELQPEHSERAAQAKSIWEMNSIEGFHSTIEGNAVRFLRELRSGKSLFYENKESRNDFLFFLSLQYMRTKKIRQSMLDGFSDRIELRNTLERIWSVVSILFAMNIASGMMRDLSRLIFLENQTVVPFITGDQPVVNILSEKIDSNPNASEVELYYPVSSRLAVLITDVKEREQKITIKSESEVGAYNDFIFKNSYEQIYSNCRRTLETFRV